MPRMSKAKWERAIAAARKRRAEMEKLRAEGWTLKQIASLFRISRQRVHQVLNNG